MLIVLLIVNDAKLRTDDAGICRMKQKMLSGQFVALKWVMLIVSESLQYFHEMFGKEVISTFRLVKY